MGYGYLTKMKNGSVNQSKSNSLTGNYISGIAANTKRENAFNNAMQSVRQFKSFDKCEGSNVIQLNIAAYQNTHRVNFGHAREGAVDEYQGLGNAAAGVIGQQQLQDLALDTGMPEYVNNLAQLPVIPGIEPQAGNHLFNTIGNSMWNFYNGLFDNIRNEPLYTVWEQDAILEADISRVWYDGIQVLCEVHDGLRDVEALRYFGATDSNNHITYSLYSTKYFFDCLNLIADAMSDGEVGVMPDFDVNQAIDQPAADARNVQAVEAMDENYVNAYNEYTAARTNLIELFEEAIMSLANYLAMKFNEWFGGNL